MQLIQVLLPLYDNDATPIRPALFQQVRDELAARFGGLTVYSRSPAEGLWQDDAGERPVHDDVVLFEVMTDQLDRTWWSAYRQTLEARFEQEEIVIRAQSMLRL